MEVTHGIALLFATVFIVIAAIFNKMLWWLLSVGYTTSVALMAIINDWELLMFVPLAIFGVISLIGVGFTALKGEII